MNGNVINNCSSLKMLGVTFDSKMKLEVHLRSVASSISHRVGLLHKGHHIYSADDVERNSFLSLFLAPF